jgi:hypothetical protein
MENKINEQVIILPLQLVDEMSKYLATKPFSEVWEFIEALKKYSIIKPLSEVQSVLNAPKNEE